MARADLKADRARRRLRGRASHAEAGAPTDAAVHLAAELGDMARWLGLDHIRVELGGGGPAAALQAECGPQDA